MNGTKNSWLGPGKENLFQRIKKKRIEEEKRGVKIVNLAIGQPQGPALRSARMGVAKAVLSEEESMHEYQDNGSSGVPDFARKFVEFHTDKIRDGMKFLPFKGFKDSLTIIPLACNSSKDRCLTVATMTRPGYPTPEIVCEFLKVKNYALPLNCENDFKVQLKDILTGTNLLMLNYPHNPSGQALRFDDWVKLCKYCSGNGIRLFNDGAYNGLIHVEDCETLAYVAQDFPDLEWAEFYSASKLIGNGTGWRVVAGVGSMNFMNDIGRIKGDLDSGFVPFVAAGVLEAIQNDAEGIEKCRKIYERRLENPIGMLKKEGMKIATEPKAGFFTLWKVPNQAFGIRIEGAEQFNDIMIERTGILGVPFEGFRKNYIRYAVCNNDVDKKMSLIQKGFEKAKVSYMS